MASDSSASDSIHLALASDTTVVHTTASGTTASDTTASEAAIATGHRDSEQHVQTQSDMTSSTDESNLERQEDSESDSDYDLVPLPFYNSDSESEFEYDSKVDFESDTDPTALVLASDTTSSDKLFPQFVRLPSELQLLVVEKVIENEMEKRDGRTTVRVKSVGKISITRSFYYTSAIPQLPAIFHASRMLRTEAWKHCQLIGILHKVSTGERYDSNNGKLPNDDLSFAKFLFDSKRDTLVFRYKTAKPTGRWNKSDLCYDAMFALLHADLNLLYGKFLDTVEQVEHRFYGWKGNLETGTVCRISKIFWGI